MNKYNYKFIEEKWQKIWSENKSFESDLEKKKKFFLTIPFPYLNGNLHAGHVRTFTIGDTISRYKRMVGFNVLFPMGFHVTGTPIVGLAEQIKKKDKQTINVYSKYHNIPIDKLLNLDTPEKIVDYFKIESEKDMRNIGYSIDWRCKFTTTSPEFKKFVEWQYHTLEDKKLLVKGSHPVKWCPNDKNPVEDHDILKGEEATIIEYIIMKFRYKNIIFPCATLRPETIYGVTNLWISTNIKYCKIQVISKENIDELWIVSEECYEKLKYTDNNIVFIEYINIQNCIGIKLKNPSTDELVTILPATFIENKIGTGVVMSVPAHSLNDYLALNDFIKLINTNDNHFSEKINKKEIINIKPIKVIEIKEKTINEKSNKKELNVLDIISSFNLEKQDDKKIKDATKILYKKEFNNGILLPIAGKYSGFLVSSIKDQLIEDFISQGIATKFYELSEEVICRCGSSCLINMVKDQWFLNYSNNNWKNKVKSCIENMAIIPEDMRTEFENKINWLKDKACARKKGLGTNLPSDPTWLIESLGDSTIYMAYYIISKYINEKKIHVNNLTIEFFDYIFLQKGNINEVIEKAKIKKEILTNIKNEFCYWYPVDLRSSGKDLVPNHLLFYLFHHVAIFDKKYWPLKIAVNGFVSLEGEKMSKSKGPLLTLKTALKEYGADITRFYILSKAEQTQDLDWKNNEIESTKKKIENFYNYIIEENEKNKINLKDEKIYCWLESKLQKYIKEANSSFENIKTRNAIQNIFYLLKNDIKWYHKRGGNNNLKNIFNIWLKLLYPFIPHVCEELWSNLGHFNYLYEEKYPQFDSNKINNELELFENSIFNITKDIEEIKNIASIEKIKDIYIITSKSWKYKILEMILNILESRADFDSEYILKEILSSEPMKNIAKDAKSYLIKILNNLKSLCINERKSYLKCFINEEYLLASEVKFFEKEFNCKVHIINSKNINMIKEVDNIYEELNLKIKRAEPGKPALYIL